MHTHTRTRARREREKTFVSSISLKLRVGGGGGGEVCGVKSLKLRVWGDGEVCGVNKLSSSSSSLSPWPELIEVFALPGIMSEMRSCLKMSYHIW